MKILLERVHVQGSEAQYVLLTVKTEYTTYTKIMLECDAKVEIEKLQKTETILSIETK